MLKKSLLLDLCFIGIALIIFSNLNGIVVALFGITAVFSSFILFFCLIIIFYLFRYKKITFPHWAYNATVLYLIVFGSIMWLFYSYMYSLDADYYKIFRKTVPSFILVYAVYKYTIYCADKGQLNKVYYITVFTLLFTTFFIPLSAFKILPGAFKALMYGGGRSAGLFTSPNLAGMHANFTLAFVLFFIIQSKRLSLLFLALMPIVLYAAFLTFSKATIIVAGLMVVLFFIYNSAIILKMPRVRRRRFGVSLLIIAVSIVVFFPHLQESFSNLGVQQLQRLQQIGEFLQGEVNAKTTTDRSELWKEAISLITAQPIQGYGLSCFANLPEARLGAHNTYLMVWGEAGILAITMFFVYIISTYYRCFFWVRDPSYRFLCISLFIVLTLQLYGAAHTGLGNSEANCMLGIIFGTLEAKRGNIDHLRYGKYLGKDYLSKLAKRNGRLLKNE